MANIYTLKSGMASDPTVWSSGVVPTASDRVLIMASHIVELDGTYEWGDDSSATITINGVSTTKSITVAGTLSHSRTVSSSLACRGHFYLLHTGTHDIGTAASPILLPVTATILLNQSAVMANNKYGYEGQARCKFSAYGSPKVRAAKLTEAVIAGANSIKVSQAEGWQAGDSIVLSQTDVTATRRQDLAVIAPGYSPGSLTIPLVANLAFSHSLACVVGNLTSNVTIKSSNPNFESGSFHLLGDNTSVANSRNMRYAAFEDLGGVYPSYGLSFRFSANYSSTNWTQPYGELQDLAIVRRKPSGAIVQTENCSATTSINFVDCIFAHVNPTAESSADHNVTAHTRFTRCYHFGVTMSFGGAGDMEYIDCHLLARGRDSITTNKGLAALVTGLKLGGWCTGYGVVGHFNAQAYCTDLVYEDCDFGVTYPIQSGLPLFYLQSLDARQAITAKDCLFSPTITEPAVSSMNCLSAESYIRIINKNKDATSQQEYRRSGVYKRDNAVAFRGTSSLSMRPNAVNRVCLRTQAVPCGNGKSVRVVGYLKMDAAYLNAGNCNAPTVTLSGLGATPEVFTAALNTDWQKFDLSAVNGSGFDGNFSLTTSATPKAVATGTIYLDGVPDAPFVTKVRHFGFLFEESSPVRVINPVVQVSEDVAATYTGVTVDVLEPKITVGTGTVDTWRKLYDWYQAWACNNLASDVLLTSADGVNFSLPVTCKLEWQGMPAGGTLNGGTLQLASAGVHSYSLSGTRIEFMAPGIYDLSGTKFNGAIELINSSGGAVTVELLASVSYVNTGPDITVQLPSTNVTIDATAIIAGSRVQLWNVTDGIELYNADLTVDGLSFELPYVSSKVIRLRADHATKLPLETVGVLTASGLTFLDVQDEDDVYLGNGIDGSLVTEFVPDQANIQVDINDPDGVTDVQRLYAWLQWYMTTEEGVRSDFFGSVSAIDSANYQIDQSKANIKLDNISVVPVRVVGGNLTRRDGTTVIAAASGSIQMDPGKAYAIETGVSGLTVDESNKLQTISTLNTSVEAVGLNVAQLQVTAGTILDKSTQTLAELSIVSDDVDLLLVGQASSTLAVAGVQTSVDSIHVPTKEVIAYEVWSATEAQDIASGTKLDAVLDESIKIRQLAMNKAVVSEDGLTVVIYSDDGVTPLQVFSISDDKRTRVPV